MNRVMLIGTMTRDAEIKIAKNGSMTVATFPLAVDRKKRKGKEDATDFIDCIAFGNTADVLSKYCGRGSKIAVEGSWQVDTYTNREGVKAKSQKCVVDSFDFIASKRPAGYTEGGQGQAPTQQDEFMQTPADDEELPFM